MTFTFISFAVLISFLSLTQHTYGNPLLGNRRESVVDGDNSDENFPLVNEADEEAKTTGNDGFELQANGDNLASDERRLILPPQDNGYGGIKLDTGRSLNPL
ncbi:hypothetical protein Btru_048094 [Bulinus truncatus]|nr:hypothetical protein Btru_048094 [Bulinus truncatus]